MKNIKEYKFEARVSEYNASGMVSLHPVRVKIDTLSFSGDSMMQRMLKLHKGNRVLITIKRI